MDRPRVRPRDSGHAHCDDALHARPGWRSRACRHDHMRQNLGASLMRAGKMDRRITIDQASTVVDDNGTPQETWTTFAACWAELLQRSTAEFMQKDMGEDTHIVVAFRVRWIDGVGLANRVTYNGVQYRLTDIKEIGRREALELRCLA